MSLHERKLREELARAELSDRIQRYDERALWVVECRDCGRWEPLPRYTYRTCTLATMGKEIAEIEGGPESEVRVTKYIPEAKDGGR
jgi:hypothetical protein